ncbi:MAG TPA: S24 family peptidase [Anaerolineales bacterium]|nr:S24 family peptidase [Anaerolineales bacterium]
MNLARQPYNSKEQMEFAQEWFEYVKYCWYPNFVASLPEPSDSVKYILEFLEIAMDQNDTDRALFEIERLQNHKIKMDHFEKVISYQLCARVFLSMMEDREEAEQMMRQALMWIPRNFKHYVGVLSWLLGVILWLREGMHDEAVNDWKAAIKEFQEISIDPTLNTSKKDWYRDVLEIMREYLKEAIRIDQLPGGKLWSKHPCPNMPKRFAVDEMEPLVEPDPPLEQEQRTEVAGSHREGQTKPTSPSRVSGDGEGDDEWYDTSGVGEEKDPKEPKKPEEEGELAAAGPPETPSDDIAQQERPEAWDGLPEQTEADKLRGFRLLPPEDLPSDESDWRIPISPGSLPSDTSPISPYVQGFLELFTVLDEIVTSPPDVIIEEPKDMPHVEVSIVRIGSRDFNVHFPGKHKSKRVVNIFENGTYFLKIKGKSMNAADIEEGDYVVIRRQSTAEDRDIVAAVIRGEDDPQKSEASLKRFITGQKMGKEKSKINQITLRAESLEEEFKDWERTFSPEQQDEDDGFSIFGVVIAYLKPIN